MPTRIELDGLQELLADGAQLVEVLARAEYAQEHLWAINIPLKEPSKQGKEQIALELGVCGAPGRTRTCSLLFRRCVPIVCHGVTSSVLAGQVGCRVRPVGCRSVWLRPVE